MVEVIRGRQFQDIGGSNAVEKPLIKYGIRVRS